MSLPNFFLAFLPQFADPGGGSLTLQMLLLGGVFIVSTILVFGSIALLADVVCELLLDTGVSDTTAVRAPFEHLCRGLGATNLRAR